MLCKAADPHFGRFEGEVGYMDAAKANEDYKEQEHEADFKPALDTAGHHLREQRIRERKRIVH